MLVGVFSDDIRQHVDGVSIFERQALHANADNLAFGLRYGLSRAFAIVLNSFGHIVGHQEVWIIGVDAGDEGGGVFPLE